MSDPTSGVPTQLDQKLELSRKLVEWYWKEGHRRGDRPADGEEWQGNYEQFVLPTGTWLRQLYEVRDGLDTVRQAAEKPRPCVALWGLSQTGKSTSVSALIDTNAHAEPYGKDQPITAAQLERDGTGGGLHWPGGLPYYFARFGSDAPEHWYQRTLNPFNAGKDASACISRFVAAAPTKLDGLVHVSDPQHPVQVQLVSPGDLLHALARGFDSECLGPALKGKPEEWTPERLDRALAEFRESHRVPGNTPPNRLAYERMLSVVETLKDLVYARVDTFAKLRTTDADWESRLEQLLSDPTLISNPDTADDFAALIFWDNSAEITKRFKDMRACYERIMKKSGGRALYASLPVTSLLLDMDSCVNVFNQQAGPETREGKQRQLIRELGARISGDRFIIGCGAAYSDEKLGATELDYCNFQGLVWELVIPIHLANLPGGAFHDLLAHTDILDFPGVGRNEKDENTRINARSPQPAKGAPWSIPGFYAEVVKRGKTASIVATYSRRLTIDSFTILQNIDKDDPKNNATDQLANGIRTWLRNMVPGFTEGDGRRPNGVSLNLGLTFWGEFVKDARADKSANFELRKKFYDKLGVISDPAVSTIFALNYHWLNDPRVKFPQEFVKGTKLFDAVLREPEFQRLFSDPVSLRSVHEMTDDLARNGSGGADFLFAQMRLQVQAQDPVAREARFAPVIDRLQKNLGSLLGWRHLKKPRSENDTRKEELDSFVKRLHAAIERRGEADVRLASHALRELLNVDPESFALPSTGRGGLTSAFVEKLFNEWKNRQQARYDHWVRGGMLGAPMWSQLGVRDREDISRVLDALITSFDRKVFVDIAQLAQRVWDTIPGRTEHRQQHLRRYLAIEMTNRLLYKLPNKRAGAGQRRFRAEGKPTAEPTGTATPAYAAFIGPFVAVQIAAIKEHLTPVVLRPPLHGDASLETIIAG